jgi:hypothetical protein
MNKFLLISLFCIGLTASTAMAIEEEVDCPKDHWPEKKGDLTMCCRNETDEDGKKFEFCAEPAEDCDAADVGDTSTVNIIYEDKKVNCVGDNCTGKETIAFTPTVTFESRKMECKESTEGGETTYSWEKVCSSYTRFTESCVGRNITCKVCTNGNEIEVTKTGPKIKKVGPDTWTTCKNGENSNSSSSDSSSDMQGYSNSFEGDTQASKAASLIDYYMLEFQKPYDDAIAAEALASYSSSSDSSCSVSSSSSSSSSESSSSESSSSESSSSDYSSSESSSSESSSSDYSSSAYSSSSDGSYYY